jgi:hypothetical protein
MEGWPQKITGKKAEMETKHLIYQTQIVIVVLWNAKNKNLEILTKNEEC